MLPRVILPRVKLALRLTPAIIILRIIILITLLLLITNIIIMFVVRVYLWCGRRRVFSGDQVLAEYAAEVRASLS